MTQRRGYPRGHLERHGIVSVRSGETINLNGVTDGEEYHLVGCDLTTDESGKRQADHHALVTKRKGWGTTGNKESRCMSIHGIDLMLKSFTPDKYMRYKINVYLKKKAS